MELQSYKLSKEADSDLEEIFNYTKKMFGFNQAKNYLTELEIVFNNLVIHPELGRKRNEIKQHLFSITAQQHSIFYRIFNNHIRIVRVLHGSKDIPRNFK